MQARFYTLKEKNLKEMRVDLKVMLANYMITETCHKYTNILLKFLVKADKDAINDNNAILFSVEYKTGN